MKKLIAFSLLILLTALGATQLSSNKVTYDNTIPEFVQVDRALGETAIDYPLRSCAANEAKKLFAKGTLTQNSYSALLKDLAVEYNRSYQFLDFRTLTRGTLPFQILNTCRSADMSSTIALSDTNGTGVPSVAYVASDCMIHYYKNSGSGKFALTVLENVPRVRMDCQFSGLIFVDVNNDGFTDLVQPRFDELMVATVLNDGKGNFNSPPIISKEVESLKGQVFSIAAGDLTKSGRDDIVIANRWQSPGMTASNISSPVRILRNTGVAPYWREDTTKSIPFLQDNWTGRSYNSQTDVPHGIWYASYAVAVMDMNNDGWNDILEIGDGQANHMLWSTKEGTVFDDKSYESGVMLATAGMGITAINLEGGKNPWLFVSDAASTFTQQCLVGRVCKAWHGNRMFVSNDTKVFSENAEKLGLANTGWAFGAQFADLGMNGYPSLIVGTGDVASGRADETFQANFDKPYLFMYDGKSWLDKSLPVLRALKSPVYTNKVVSADMDGDNKPDLILFGYETQAPYLLVNRTEGKSSTVTLTGSGKPGKATNFCTGCRVRVEVENHAPYTLWNVWSQQNFGVSTTNVPLVIGFGSGNSAELEITYPDGRMVKKTIKPNKHYLIKE
jgi:hypothetical protein